MKSIEDIAIELAVLKQTLEQVEQENRENYGAIRELNGELKGLRRFEEVNRSIIHVTSEVGEIRGKLLQIVESLRGCDVEEVADAMSGIVINVQGGSGGTGGDATGGSVST